MWSLFGKCWVVQLSEKAIFTLRLTLSFSQAAANIPGAGFGMYTAVGIPRKFIMVGSSHPALVTPDRSVFWPGWDYVWAGQSFDVSSVYGGAVRAASVLCPLFGAMGKSSRSPQVLTCSIPSEI